jgi:hypothetical protein
MFLRILSTLFEDLDSTHFNSKKNTMAKLHMEQEYLSISYDTTLTLKEPHPKHVKVQDNHNTIRTLLHS